MKNEMLNVLIYAAAREEFALTDSLLREQSLRHESAVFRTQHVLNLSQALVPLIDDSTDVCLFVMDKAQERFAEAFDVIAEVSPNLPIVVIGSADQEARVSQHLGKNVQDFLLLEELTASQLQRAVVFARRRYIVNTERAALSEKLEGARQAQEDYLRNLGTQLCSPLTSILGFAERLLEEERSYEDQRPLRAIVQNCNTLSRIINRQLTMSRIAGGGFQLEIRPVSVIGTLARLDSSLQREAAEHGLALHMRYGNAVPLEILTDQSVLRQVLAHLVQNAIKVSEAGEVAVDITFDSGARKLRFAVRDTGPHMLDGVSAAVLYAENEKNLLALPQVEKLGFAICAQLAEMLGGSLTCASGSSGNELVLTIDAPLPIEEREDHAISGRALSGRVLLIQAEEDARELLRTRLETLGCTVTAVSTHDHAAELATKERYDLLVLDDEATSLGASGAAALYRVRGLTTPLLLLSSTGEEAELAELSESGISAFLAKPFTRVDLYSALKRFLRPQGPAIPLSRVRRSDRLRPEAPRVLLN